MLGFCLLVCVIKIIELHADVTSLCVCLCFFVSSLKNAIFTLCAFYFRCELFYGKFYSDTYCCKILMSNDEKK